MTPSLSVKHCRNTYWGAWVLVCVCVCVCAWVLVCVCVRACVGIGVYSIGMCVGVCVYMLCVRLIVPHSLHPASGE